MNTLEKYISFIASSILVLSISMILLNVFYRYVLLGLVVDYFGDYDSIMSGVDYIDVLVGDIVVTSDEIPGYLLIWISFLGAFMAARNPGHINFDLIINKFPDYKKSIIILNYSAIVIFFILFFFLSVQMIQIDGSTEIETADIAQGYFMLILPIASALFVLAYLEKIWHMIKGDK